MPRRTALFCACRAVCDAALDAPAAEAANACVAALLHAGASAAAASS